MSEAAKRTLLFFSGGRDSFLTALRLVERGYDPIHLITFTNGAMIGNGNATRGAGRLAEALRQDNDRTPIVSLGIHNLAGIIREFTYPLFNRTAPDLASRYGEVTISQINCLLCRTSMYVFAVAIAGMFDVNVIATGSRQEDPFVCERKIMRKHYKELLQDHGLQLVEPLRKISTNTESNWDRKNMLLRRGFVPKTSEPQCLLGVPPSAEMTEAVEVATEKLYQDAVFPRIERVLADLSRFSLLDAHARREYA